jgi:hypothetical protein
MLERETIADCLISFLQRLYFEIMNSFVRSSAEVRNKLLSYFEKVLLLNQKRAAMQVDPRTVSSDGFIHNITCVLLKLCEPFVDPNAGKVRSAWCLSKPLGLIHESRKVTLWLSVGKNCRLASSIRCTRKSPSA